MKKMLTVILTVAMLMTAATAFADGGEGAAMNGSQMGGPQMQEAPQMDGQMNGPMGDPQMDGQMNGPMGGPQMGGNGEQQPPEKPADEQAPENNQKPPEKPADGQAPENNQQPPEKPADGQQPPEKPSGEKPADAPAEPEEQNGEQSEAPSNDQQVPQTPENNQQPPEKPENGQQPPEKPADGQQPPEKPANGQQGPQMPSNNQQGSQMPMNGQQAPGMIDFDALVTEGVISQETREKIRTFMDEHKPADMPSDGQAPADGQQSPEMPSEGQAPNGGQPDLLSDLKDAGILTQEECDAISSATVNNAQMPGGQGMPGGFPGESGNVEYASATTVTEDADGATYSSTGEGENAVLISGSQVALTNATVTKTGSSNSGEADFNGINAAVLATSGSTVTLSDASVTTDGMHANGVFSYGAGTTVNVSDTTITTTGNCSGGLMTTGGATMNASNLTVSTAGNSSAAIRSDRGGGTVNVASGTYDTAGVGSPAIYSTADITVSDATLKATNSEAVVIEGGNSVTLENVDITGSNGQLNGQSTHKTNVLIYQSMSGDASEGSSTFTMNGGTMTCETGSMFHVTNTTTTVNLNGVAFNYSADSSVFLDATADSWGASGSNGGNVTLNLTNQDITGAIVADSASTVAVNLDGNSTWTLGGDSYVTTFTGDLSRVNTNGYTLYVNGEAVA